MRIWLVNISGLNPALANHSNGLEDGFLCLRYVLQGMACTTQCSSRATLPVFHLEGNVQPGLLFLPLIPTLILSLLHTQS